MTRSIFADNTLVLDLTSKFFHTFNVSIYMLSPMSRLFAYYREPTRNISISPIFQ